MSANTAALSAEAAYRLLGSGQAPDGLRVAGVLDFSVSSGRDLPPQFPRGLRVDVLNLTDRENVSLPPGLQAYELNLTGTSLRELPADLNVRMRLDLTRCDRLESLPAGLTVGTLV